MAVKRTRPGAKGTEQRPVRTVVIPSLNAPFPGCCTPYPDATFRNSILVKLVAHHNGPRCKGYPEPMDIGAWNAEIDERMAAGDRRDGGDDG